MQYNTSVGDFNSDKLTPYPADLSRARVSVEEAPVDILAPQDSIFHYPNTITEADFNGWVQERGLYFMSKWDDHYTPLLACHDPGRIHKKAACCGHSMARAHTSTPLMPSSASCPLVFLERYGCM